MIKLTPVADQVLRQNFSKLEKEDAKNYKTDQNLEIGVNKIILTAANGSRYSLTISNTGVLGTQLEP